MNDILIHTEGGITTLTLNRVAKKNALTTAMYATLADALEVAEADSAVHVVLIQGAPTIFSAGNDISDFLNRPPAQGPIPAWRFLRNLAQFPKPIIAAVCGPAVGIGTTMLLHCDVVYAGENAIFSLPFVNLGLCPEAASSLLLPQMFGHHRAAETLLFGEPLTAATALAWGLVNQVVAPEQACLFALAQARKLVSKPLLPLMETKRLMKSHQHAATLARMGEEEICFDRMLNEPAAREAFTAFLEKRPPDFSQC